MIEDSYVIAFGNGSSSSVFSDKFVCSVSLLLGFIELPSIEFYLLCFVLLLQK